MEENPYNTPETPPEKVVEEDHNYPENPFYTPSRTAVLIWVVIAFMICISFYSAQVK
jgi:hypothetical protein